MSKEKCGRKDKPVVILILVFFCVGFFQYACGKKEHPPALEEEYLSLLSELDPETLGVSIQELSKFAEKYERYLISDQANYKIKLLKSKTRKNYLHARDLARAKKFDKAEKILTDLATYFPDSTEGEQAKTYLNFNFQID